MHERCFLETSAPKWFLLKWETTSVLLCLGRQKWKLTDRLAPLCTTCHFKMSNLNYHIFLKLPSWGWIVSSSLVWQTDLGLTGRAGKYVTEMLVLRIKQCGSHDLICVVCRGLGEDIFFMWHPRNYGKSLCYPLSPSLQLWIKSFFWKADPDMFPENCHHSP